MKILHVCWIDNSGGAAIAAYRLHRGLLGVGVDSRMLVARKQSDDHTVLGPEGMFSKVAHRLRPHLTNPILKWQKSDNPIQHSLNLLPSGLHRRINAMDVDVVNLHWINGEMISIAEIARIRKPVVWTLHDMWAFCGAEHHSGADGPMRYREGYLAGNRGPGQSGLDLDRWVWKRKKRQWRDATFQIVTPSRWLQKCAASSVLFSRYPVHYIPNGLDPSVFKPIDRTVAREILSLPQEKKLILFGAPNSTKNPNKGFSHLQSAIRTLAGNGWRDQADVVVFGSGHPREAPDMGMNAHYLGHLSDQVTMSIVYAAADVFVLSSIHENLPNTVMESLACGTPVAAFAVGGTSDMVEHRHNGYLARPYEADDLASGIAWILEYSARWKELSLHGRTKVEANFAVRKVAQQYAALYRTLR